MENRQPVEAYVSLGSNLGRAGENLKAALELLGKIPGVEDVCASSVFRTEPMDMRDQPWFLNQAARLAVDPGRVGPEQLLRVMLGIEKGMGRVRGVRFGPRIIDLDLLLYDDMVLASPELTLPHPRMAERAFVLVPLLELAPDLALPDGRMAAEVLEALQYRIEGDAIYQS